MLLFLIPWIVAAGCSHHNRRVHHRPPPLPPLVQAPPNSPPRDLLIDSQKKAVLGHPDSYSSIERVVKSIRPILDQAIDQPEIRAVVAEDANAAHLPVPRFKQFFLDKQEADILLESGGNSEALSIAGAAGVAQWLVDTGRGRGRLRIDAARTRQLTAQIDALTALLVRLRQQPATYIETWPISSGPTGTGSPPVSVATRTEPSRERISTTTVITVRTGTTPATAPPTTVPPTTVMPTTAPPVAVPTRTWTREELITSRELQIHDLVARRRAIDDRYDPQLALFAQTRYLIWLWQRYPSLDWVFEAYHGGEAGVARTLATFLGPTWQGSVTQTILGDDTAGRPVRYEDIFFSTTPRTHPAAFRYLYGLKDEHHLYWFKLLMAEKALTWYRRDPKGLHDEWEALRPGYRLEDAWYPDEGERVLPDGSSVASALSKGELVRVPPGPAPGVQIGRLPFVGSQDQTAAARPEVIGALSEVAHLYRQESQRPQTLVVPLLTWPASVSDRARARFPLPAPRQPPSPGTIPSASLPDFHTMGLAATILKPTDPWEARVLDYALSYWEDRERIHFNSENWGKIQGWRIVPNPEYRTELLAAGRR